MSLQKEMRVTKGEKAGKPSSLAGTGSPKLPPSWEKGSGIMIAQERRDVGGCKE